MTTEYEFQEKCGRLVQVEVHAPISNLVYTLAKSYGSVDSRDRDLSELVEQAWELARPTEDWESAAADAGWKHYDADGSEEVIPPGDDPDEEWWYLSDDPSGDWFPTAKEACEANDIEPHEREIYEHWIVSDWLAARLEERGERIDHDFTGLTVWGRTTTGQAISMDYVIRQIVRELHNLDVEA